MYCEIKRAIVLLDYELTYLGGSLERISYWFNVLVGDVFLLCVCGIEKSTEGIRRTQREKE